MTRPAKREASTVERAGHVDQVYAFQSRYPYVRGDVWLDMASAWDTFGRWSRYRFNKLHHGSGTAKQVDLDALRGDYLRVMGDFWKAIEKFETDLPDEKLPREQRLFDPDETHRAP